MKYQIDIETLSTKPNALVLSVGICNANGNGDQIYLPKNPQINSGRHVMQETINWWRKPERAEYYNKLNDECYKAWMDDVMIQHAHKLIHNFFMLHDDCEIEDREVWMNSPAFDGVILETLFDQFDLDVPWHYRNLRDFRTLKMLALQKNPELVLPETPKNLHDALVDCQWQMEQTHIYLAALGV